MKEALQYSKEENGMVHCHVCPKECLIGSGDRGLCLVRNNKEGKLDAHEYGKNLAAETLNIEQAGLFHYLPGKRCLSVNVREQPKPKPSLIKGPKQRVEDRYNPSQIGKAYAELMPAHVIERAYAEDLQTVAFLKLPQTSQYEYVIDAARLTSQEGLRSALITDGYLTQSALAGIAQHIDAAVIIIPSNDEGTVPSAQSALNSSLKALKFFSSQNIWVEAALPLRQGADSHAIVQQISQWIVKSINKNVPLHLSLPLQQRNRKNPDESVSLMELARKSGLNNIYFHNSHNDKALYTYCWSCKKLLVARTVFGILSNNIRNGRCAYCRQDIPGVWK